MWAVSPVSPAKVAIELTEITLDWFTFDEKVEKVDFYVFTLDPASDEALVDVYALIEKEKTPADALTGITLKVDETVVDVGKPILIKSKSGHKPH